MEHSVEENNGVKVLAVSGAIDVSRALELRDLLGELVGQGDARVLLDLGEVPLIDSSGIGVLVTAHRTAESAGAAFALANPSSPVGRVFELTRTNRLLRIFTSVEEGVAALGTDGA